MTRCTSMMLAGWLAVAAGCGDDDHATDAGLDSALPDAAADAGLDDAGPDAPGDAGSGACGAGIGECSDDGWCDYPEPSTCGEDGYPGACRPRPDACPEYYSPVCGCDGTTYGNPCEAQAGGTDVAHSGECGTTDVCDGFAGTACPATEWCDYPDGSRCGAGDVGGECRPRPDGCAFLYAPVCGCDGTTYANDCLAHSEGVDVAYLGECVGGDACGGIAGFSCDPFDWCDYPDSAACGVGDVAGTCRLRPEVCTGLYDPVCGCDDVTYGNACVANSAGVDVAAEGECNPADPCAPQDARGVGACDRHIGYFWDGSDCRAVSGCSCDGTDCARGFESLEICETMYRGCAGAISCTGGGAECAARAWCDFAASGACGAGGSIGICRPRPEACDAVYDPVCACDGRTYGNACEAASAGSDVEHMGACGSGDRCAPQDARGSGPCDLFLGHYWDGMRCVPESGCSCVGVDCGSGWLALEDCDRAHVGCVAPGDVCGGSGGATCTPALYCDWGEPPCGRAPGASGVCRVRPEVCPDLYAPVCGCDGETHGNACEAAAVGIDVDYRGECGGSP